MATSLERREVMLETSLSAGLRSDEEVPADAPPPPLRKTACWYMGMLRSVFSRISNHTGSAETQSAFTVPW